MLKLTPFEIMERFETYTERGGIKLTSPGVFSPIDMPEATGWEFTTRDGKKVIIGIQQKKVKGVVLYTLSAGPYFLNLDPAPPNHSLSIVLGAVTEGDGGPWDLSILIEEVAMATAFSRALAYLKLLDSKVAETPK